MGIVHLARSNSSPNWPRQGRGRDDIDGEVCTSRPGKDRGNSRVRFNEQRLAGATSYVEVPPQLRGTSQACRADSIRVARASDPVAMNDLYLIPYRMRACGHRKKITRPRRFKERRRSLHGRRHELASVGRRGETVPRRRIVSGKVGPV